MIENTEQTEIVDRDRELLLGLYEYRALSTKHIMEMYGFTRPYLYKKLMELRNKELIYSENIVGYDPTQARQGSYYRISQKGLNLLSSYGHDIKHIAGELRVTKYRIAYLLTAYDLLISLKPYGWNLIESRQAKKETQIDGKTGIQGILVSPEGEEYPFYIFINPIKALQMGKIINELKTLNFNNLIMFARTREALAQITEEIGNKTDVANFNSLRVFPLLYGKYYLRSFDKRDNLINYLELNHDIEYLYTDKQNKHGFEIIVNHEGEEKYLANLLDHDLTMFYKMKAYKNEDYEQDGKKILAITNTRVAETHQAELTDLHHTDYLIVNYEQLITHLSNIEPYAHSFSENSNNQHKNY